MARSLMLGAGRTPDKVPVMREEFSEPMHRMCGNARQYIAEPGEWLDTTTLTRCDEAHQNGCRPTASVASEERPVAASDCDIAIGPLGRAVIDRQVSILEKS